MGYCYAVTSGKGGTGKSTVSVGLATAFAAKGKRTLLIDMDEGLRCLDILLGAENRLVFDLADTFTFTATVTPTPSTPNSFSPRGAQAFTATPKT